VTEANIAEDLESLAVPLRRLTLSEVNPRRGDVEAVARSYAQFGQRKPVVARITGGRSNARRGEVIAGNHQVRAAESLGWDRIAVVWVRDDPTTASAFALADNRTSDLATYDDDELRGLLAALESEPDLLAAASWTQDDVDDLLASAQEDALPENVRQDKNYNDFLDKYATQTTRTILLDYPRVIFEWMVDRLVDLRAEGGYSSNAETVLALVAERTGQQPPSPEADEGPE
jgi:ParB-like chromosome segregation protein Spo0J